jgi:hypothetical protein
MPSGAPRREHSKSLSGRLRTRKQSSQKLGSTKPKAVFRGRI